MTAEAGQIAGGLRRLAPLLVPGATGASGLTRLSGGASQETWSFVAEGAGAPVRLILRRAPQGRQPSSLAVGLATEAALIRLAAEAGVPVPTVRHVLVPGDDLGEGFITDFVEGETIARKILRDPAFDGIRPHLARRCGEILARIHAIDPARLPVLRSCGAAAQLAELAALYRGADWPKPVFDYALRWLAARTPPDPAQMVLVHGDFRNGNLIVGPDGIRAVLDWEIALRGDPMQDLGWICVGSWRFGEIDKPVGGFGTREALFAGYEAAGGTVDPTRVRFWEVFGTLRWGVICLGAVRAFRGGADMAVERAMIARRSSETEMDLMRLLAAG